MGSSCCTVSSFRSTQSHERSPTPTSVRRFTTASMAPRTGSPSQPFVPGAWSAPSFARGPGPPGRDRSFLTAKLRCADPGEVDSDAESVAAFPRQLPGSPSLCAAGRTRCREIGGGRGGGLSVAVAPPCQARAATQLLWATSRSLPTSQSSTRPVSRVSVRASGVTDAR